MNAGQMFVQMSVGTVPPVAVQAPAPAASLPTGDREASAFAGVLRDMSPRESARPAVAAGSGRVAQVKASPACKTGAAPLQPEPRPDVPATLLAAGVEGTGPVAADEDVAEMESEEEKGMCPEVQLPQKVVLCAAEAGIVAAQQQNGRMPETEQEHDCRGSQPITAGTAELVPLPSVATPVEAGGTQMLDVPHIVGNAGQALAAVLEKASPVAAETGRPIVAHVRESAGLTEQEPGTAVAARLEVNPAATEVPLQIDPAAIALQNAPRQAGSDVETGRLSVKNAVPAETPAITQPLDIRQDTRIEAAPPAAEAVHVDAVVPGIPAVSAASPEISRGDDSTLPVEKTVSVVQPRPNMDAYFQTSVRPVAVTVPEGAPQEAQTVVPLPDTEAPTGMNQAVNAVQRSVRGEVSPLAELPVAQEQPLLRQAAAEEGATSESVAELSISGSVKEAAATAPGNQFSHQGGNFGERGAAGNAHLAMAHQVVTENVLPSNAASAVPASEPIRSGLAEQVVGQVRDHLAGREIKTGVEQVVIRLTPENLGELQMSLRMENQRLKVEIVAETPTVRDALMKHADTLKESLARQNITMESFDVSTGGNRFGSASQGQAQGDWRELARQRQYNAWATSGGYRPETAPVIPQRPQYQASSGHSMVDVHF